AEIGRDGHQAAVSFARDLGRRLLERLFAPRADRDVDAFPRKRAGNAFADADAAAGHQCGLAVELKVHVGLLVRGEIKSARALSGKRRGAMWQHALHWCTPPPAISA